ncbi:MAG: VOC family protein [Myxococcales bacterium]|nr:VOC family protein [Myxococcales bacterium]
MLQRTDRISIAVEDLGRAQKEMMQVLGRSPAWVGGYPGDETACVLFRLDNVCIELLSPLGDTATCNALRVQIEARGGGLHALHLASDDLAATVEELRDHGLNPSEPVEGLTKDEPSGAFRRFLQSVLDPAESAGVRIHLVEWLSAPEELPPSLAIDGERAAVMGGDHVVIFSGDAERAIDLYGTKLGIRLALDRTFEKRKTRILFFRLGHFTIEIGTPLGNQTDEPAKGDRLWGLAYRVDDIDAASERIAKAGLEVSEIREGHKAGTRVCTLKSKPAGVATLIIQQELHE